MVGSPLGMQEEARGQRQWLAPVRSAWRRLRASPFGRDFALILALKVVLIAALYVFLFRPALRPRQDPAATAAAITGAQPRVPHEVPR